MSKSGPFSPVVVGFLVAGVVATFALSVVLLAVGGGHEPARSGSASPSAVGHLGFYALLEKLEVPVGNSRLEGDAPAGRNGVLIVDEPQNAFAKNLKIDEARTVLVILPKRWSTKDEDHDGWVKKVGLLDLYRPQAILNKVLEGAKVSRGVTAAVPGAPAGKPDVGRKPDAAGRPASGRPATIARTVKPRPAAPAETTPASINTLGAEPLIEGETQLVSSKILKPLIGSPDRMLLGELQTQHQRIWILADPDPLENFGLQKPANLKFAMALVNALRGADGRVIFDDVTSEGRAKTRSPLELLFKWPFVLVTVQILVALGLLLAATTARFGGAELAPVPFALGKLRLIENIGSLMDRAGHQSVVLRRYIKVKLHEAGRTLHAPPGLDDGALAAWLDRIGASRGVGLKAAEILERGAQAGGGRAQTMSRLFRDARDMDRWNREIVHGSGGRKNSR